MLAPDLAKKVALVTGASRGVGKGVALALCEAGATVCVTGRTTEEGSGPDGLPGTILRTAIEATTLGGKCIPIRCDHRDDAQVTAAFERVETEQGGLDILVNNVWGGYENLMFGDRYVEDLPFWEQPIERWDSMFAAGVRAHYVASVLAARSMVRRKSGLIVTISFWAAQKFMGSPAYGAAKAADDKMTKDMAHQLRGAGVAAVALYPGLVRTENVMRFAQYLDLSASESPQFTGRAIASLAGDRNVMAKTGQVLVVADLAVEYGFRDVDGQPARAGSTE